MYQKDYILRMVQMLAEMIAGILGLIKKGDYEKAEESINHIYYDLLKQDASFFKGIKKESLTNTLLQEHNYTNGHLEILAELFNVEGELLMKQGKAKESLEFFEKALLLHQFVIEQTSAFSIEKDSKVNELKERIKQVSQTNR